ncbi:MAG: TonB-dependent receptor [Bacteroidetes bacterium]|nr:TonB-dependent receptor [Bacteroidota bacterium]
MKSKLILVATLLMASRISHAQQADTTRSTERDTVTITATRSEKDPTDVGKSITIISNEQIKNSGANNLAELLSQQEGIYVVGAGQNPGQQQSIFTRGANSNQTNVMIDGMKISDPSGTENAIDLSEISLDNIDRIEIVRGSNCALYGSSAIGGVINIITKKNQAPGFHTDAELKSGTFGPHTSLFTENVGMNYTLKNGLYVNAGIYNGNINGMNATVDTVTDPNNYKHNHLDRDNFRSTDLLGKLGYRNEKYDIFVSYKNISQHADIDKGAFDDDDNYTSQFHRNLTTYGASYKLNEKFSISYAGGLTDLNHLFTDDSSRINTAGNYDGTFYTATYKANVFNDELQANFKLKGISGVFGGGLFDEKMTFDSYYYSNTFGVYESRSNLDSLKINVKTISEFAHVDIDGSIINDNYKAFSIGLGVRNSKHDLFGNNFTYEINPSLKVSEGGLLFASYATGFNAPSLYELYSPDKDFTSGITRGNKTLKPETSSSWEFGFKQKVNDKITYTITCFRTVVQNSIDYVYLWDKNRPVDSLGFGDYRGDTYINIGKQTNQGVEIAISSKISEKFWINGNLSLISGKLDYSPASIDTSHTHGNHVQLFTNGAFINQDVETIGLVRRPGTANLGFTYMPCKKLSIAVNARYAGPRSDIYYSASSGPFGSLATKGVGDYTLVDGIAKYSATQNFSITLRAENIFDVKYSEIYGYTTRGRGFYLTLRYKM